MEEAVSTQLIGDRCQKEPRVVSNPRAGLVGQSNPLKDRQMWIEKPSSLLVTGLGHKVIHPKRNACVWQGISPRKGMLAGSSKAGIDGFK